MEKETNVLWEDALILSYPPRGGIPLPFSHGVLMAQELLFEKLAASCNQVPWLPVSLHVIYLLLLHLLSSHLSLSMSPSEIRIDFLAMHLRSFVRTSLDRNYLSLLCLLQSYKIKSYKSSLTWRPAAKTKECVCYEGSLLLRKSKVVHLKE